MLRWGWVALLLVTSVQGADKKRFAAEIELGVPALALIIDYFDTDKMDRTAIRRYLKPSALAEAPLLDPINVKKLSPALQSRLSEGLDLQKAGAKIEVPHENPSPEPESAAETFI